MRLALLAGFLLAVTLGPASASPPAVGGLTTVSGPASSMIEVTIEADTSLPLEDFGEPIEVTASSGRFAAVFLHRLCTSTPGGLCDQAIYVTPRGSLACASAPCRPMQYQMVQCYCEDDPEESVPLRAGTYRIVLAGETGTTVTATLPFDGIDGEVSLATTEPAGIDYEILDGGVALNGERRYTSDSATRDIPVRGYSYFFSPSADQGLAPGVTAKNTVQFICKDRPSDAAAGPIECPGPESNVAHVVPGWPFHTSEGSMTVTAGFSGVLTHTGVCGVSWDCSAGAVRWTHRGIATGPPGLHNHVESLALWTDWCGPFSCFDR